MGGSGLTYNFDVRNFKANSIYRVTTKKWTSDKQCTTEIVIFKAISYRYDANIAPYSTNGYIAKVSVIDWFGFTNNYEDASNRRLSFYPVSSLSDRENTEFYNTGNDFYMLNGNMGFFYYSLSSSISRGTSSQYSLVSWSYGGNSYMPPYVLIEEL